MVLIAALAFTVMIEKLCNQLLSRILPGVPQASEDIQRLVP